MKHPTSEAWMAYLYNDYPENSEASCAEAEAHLADCAECRLQVRQWRATLGLLNEDEVPESDAPIAVAALVPAPASGAWSIFRGQALVPWALAAGVMLVAAFVAGRAMGPSRTEFQQELAKARVEMAGEIALELRAELRTEQQRDLADLAAVTLKASSVAQRDLYARLLAEITETRLKDRQDYVTALDRLEQKDQLRSEEIVQLRDGFQSLAEKTGGAFDETDTRLNALASALPVTDAFETQ